MPLGFLTSIDAAELARAHAENEPHTHPPVREAAVDELRSRYKDYITNNRIQCGTLCDFKQGFDPRPACVQHQPVMLLRYLSPSDPVDAMIIKNCVEKSFRSRVDCIVFELVNDGGATIPVPCDSYTLIPIAED